MKLTKGKLIAAGVICGALVITYVAGGGYAVKDSTPLSATNSVTDSAVAAVSSQEDSLTATGGAVTEDPKDSEAKDGSGKSNADGQEKGTMTAAQKVALAQSMGSDASSAGVKKGSSDYSQSKGMSLDPETGKDKYLTEPVPEGKPVPVEPQDTVISDKKLTCTLSVRCDTILDNISALDPEKVELVPTSGAILATATVTFYEGESVFNVLQREMKKNKIHMEFVNTPLYNSAYIEGINNLYEFDCGELSGWMYKVNDWFPNYGCSRYQLKQGDVIEWVYTCDLGRDVGGYYSTGG